MIYLFLITLAILNPRVRTLIYFYAFDSKFQNLSELSMQWRLFQGWSVQWHCNCKCNVHIILLLNIRILLLCACILCIWMKTSLFWNDAVQRSLYKFTEIMLTENTMQLCSSIQNFSLHEKNSMQCVMYLTEIGKLSVGLNWKIVADIIFSEVKDWWFKRTFSHPLTSCSLNILFTKEKCGLAAPWGPWTGSHSEAPSLALQTDPSHAGAWQAGGAPGPVLGTWAFAEAGTGRRWAGGPSLAGPMAAQGWAVERLTLVLLFNQWGRERYLSGGWNADPEMQGCGTAWAERSHMELCKAW